MKSNLLLLASACMLSLVSCTKDTDNSTNISEVELSAMASSDDLITMRTSGTDKEKWIIKMNETASRIHSNDLSQFPNNSMIVKEKHDASGKISGYDVMYHSPEDLNSNNGWLWSQLDGNKKIIYSTSNKGAACASCHTMGDRIQH